MFWKATVNASASLVCVHVLLGGPEYSVRCAKFIRRSITLVWKSAVSLMPRDSLQVTALAREIASQKGKLTFLWNSERVRRQQARQTENIVTGVPRVPGSNGANLNYSPFQFQIGMAFLAEIVVGCVILTTSVCLGIWIGYTLPYNTTWPWLTS